MHERLQSVSGHPHFLLSNNLLLETTFCCATKQQSHMKLFVEEHLLSTD